MDHFSEEDIGKLLRLKRYEQPPPAYFDNFLHEFHRRQRAELLKQPLWRIALQRAHDFMFDLNVPALTSYRVAAAAVVLCAAVLTVNVVRTDSNTATHIASASPAATQIARTSDAASDWDLSRPVAMRGLSKPLRMPNPTATTHGRPTTPRYVLDSTPVSYEASLRF
ncbi:MAG TPA: hypothetical protein VGC85_02850 [Chthoniobacterales bacterium]|jgi:hypothetical protein